MANVAPDCPFCVRVLTRPELLLSYTPLSVAFEDAYPSSAGHTLVIPRRHVARLRDLTEDEYADLWRLARRQAARIESFHRPDALTIGVNDGPAAGQTVPHVHLHLIPRVTGDVAEPKGGLRWVLPGTAAYWDT